MPLLGLNLLTRLSPHSTALSMDIFSVKTATNCSTAMTSEVTIVSVPRHADDDIFIFRIPRFLCLD